MGKIYIYNASAGCGKTERIANLYVNLVKDGKAKPQEIVCVTYTEKAARELKTRIISKAKENGIDIMTISKIQSSHIGTIHSFCMYLLRFYWLFAKIDTNFKITPDMNNLFFKLLNDYFSQNANILTKLDVQKFFIEEYMEFLEDMIAEFTNSLKYVDRARAFDSDINGIFDYLLDNLNGHFLKEVTYDLVLIRTYSLLKNAKIRKDINERFKYIIVDEFQDSNFLQKSIFESITQNIIYVGDKKQSIYRFQGAEPQVFEEAIAMCDEIVELDTNYRTNSYLGEKIDAICQNLFPNYKPLKYHYSENGFLKIVELVNPKNEERQINEALYVARAIKNMVESGFEISVGGKEKRRVDYFDFAILSRKIQSIFHIYKDVFESLDIPLEINYRRGILDQKEVLPLWGLLNVLQYPDKKSGYIMLLGNDVFRTNPFLPLFCESKNLENLLPERIREFILKSRENLFVKKLSEILYQFDEVFDYSYRAYNVFGKSGFENVKMFYDLAEESQAFSITELHKFINNQEKILQTGEASKKSVCMMSIHSSKGLSFPIVFLVGLADGIHPGNKRTPKLKGEYDYKDKTYFIAAKWHEKDFDGIKKSSKEQDEEELKRLFYVAITRPMAGLFIIDSTVDEKVKIRKQKTFGDVVNLKGIIGLSNSIGIDFERIVINANEYNANLTPSCKVSEPMDIKPVTILTDEFENRFRYLSPTHIMDYKKCKILFVFKYILGLPIFDEFYSSEELSKNGKVLGTVVHRVLELTSLKTTDSLDQNIRLAMLENDFEDEEIIRELVFNYFDSDIINSIKKNVLKEESEVPFYFKLGNQMIYGIIDKVYHTNDEIYLLDFKTNVRFDENKFFMYIPQLFLYTKAMSERHPDKIIKSGILWLRAKDNKNFFEYKMDDKDYQDVLCAINEIRSIKIKKDVLFIIENDLKNKSCDGCDFQFYCNDTQNLELIIKKLE